eukprot:Nk52_evm10s228 gene=Nk52_evmTU10s228
MVPVYHGKVELAVSNGSIGLYKLYLSNESEIPFSDLKEKFIRLAQPANTTKRKLQDETDSEAEGNSNAAGGDNAKDTATRTAKKERVLSAKTSFVPFPPKLFLHENCSPEEFEDAVEKLKEDVK